MREISHPDYPASPYIWTVNHFHVSDEKKNQRKSAKILTVDVKTVKPK